MGTLPQPAIVVAAWNRPQSLQRLLEGLSRGHFPAGTILHISIDHFEYPDVRQLADAFVWSHGEKVVEQHPRRLGLRQHMLHCGGLTARYGSIILLEDDLAISPFAYGYAVESLAYFSEDEAIAGISLYDYAVAESCLQPFQPWLDQWDNWFLQMPSSWGAAFTAAQWQAFQDWLAVHFQQLPTLPTYIETWSAQSWKKLFAAYLIATGRYFSYPRFSLTTNFEDFGAHANTKGLFQVPLLMGERQWKFGRIGDSLAVYDAHFEPLAENLKRIAPALAGHDFAVDLLGQKSSHFLTRPWTLTRRRGGGAVMTFSGNALPLELNLHLQSPGDDFRLVPAHAVLTGEIALQMEFGYYAGVAKTPLLHLPDRRMPSISLIVPCSEGAHENADLMDFLLNEDYPGKELIFVVEPGKMPENVWSAYKNGRIRLVESTGSAFEGTQKAVIAATGQLIQVVSRHFYPAAGSLERICRIFRQFPGLDWLSGIAFHDSSRPMSLLMAPFRWDSARFQDATDAQVAEYLPFPLQVFRRALWQNAPLGATTLQAQFRNMGGLALPQISALELGQWVQTPAEAGPGTWGKGRVNGSRIFYHRHIPLLWKLHRRWSDYRPVLRFDGRHETWYEFDY